MDKVIGILMSASVLLVGAVIVISISSGGLTDFGQSVDKKKDAGCEFQADQIEPEEGEELTEGCQDSEVGYQVAASKEYGDKFAWED